MIVAQHARIADAAVVRARRSQRPAVDARFPRPVRIRELLVGVDFSRVGWATHVDVTARKYKHGSWSGEGMVGRGWHVSARHDKPSSLSPHVVHVNGLRDVADVVPVRFNVAPVHRVVEVLSDAASHEPVGDELRNDEPAARAVPPVQRVVCVVEGGENVVEPAIR